MGAFALLIFSCPPQVCPSKIMTNVSKLDQIWHSYHKNYQNNPSAIHLFTLYPLQFSLVLFAPFPQKTNCWCWCHLCPFEEIEMQELECVNWQRCWVGIVHNDILSIYLFILFPKVISQLLLSRLRCRKWENPNTQIWTCSYIRMVQKMACQWDIQKCQHLPKISLKR